MTTLSERAYYAGFVAVLVAVFTPFKIVGYVLPWLFVGYLMFAAPASISRNRLFIVLIVLAAVPIAYDVLADEFIHTNYLLALLTYSAWLPVVVIDGRQLASRALLERMLAATSVMILVQGTVGLVQAFYGFTETGTFSLSNGDVVQGTIYPFLSAEGRGANPMFAVNMAFMLLASLALPERLHGARRTRLLVGTAALVLASVMHVLVFLVVGVLAAILLTRSPSLKRRKARSAGFIVAAVVAIAATTYWLMPENVEQISNVAASLVDLEEGLSPRAVLLFGVATELPDDAPSQPIVGLGPGQFSSRASLIGSGLFLGGPDNPKPIPLLEPRQTYLAQKYCFALLAAYADQLEFIGSSQQPFFSVLSVYTELGILGLVAVGIAVVQLVLRVRGRARTDAQARHLALLTCAGIILLALLGFQENYWEMPQAVLAGVLLLKVMHANVMSRPLPSRAPDVSR